MYTIDLYERKLYYLSSFLKTRPSKMNPDGIPERLDAFVRTKAYIRTYVSYYWCLSTHKTCG